jgi:hypothetical protein
VDRLASVGHFNGMARKASNLSCERPPKFASAAKFGGLVLIFAKGGGETERHAIGTWVEQSFLWTQEDMRCAGLG